MRKIEKNAWRLIHHHLTSARRYLKCPNAPQAIMTVLAAAAAQRHQSKLHTEL
jgi:hypothetical protein